MVDLGRNLVRAMKKLVFALALIALPMLPAHAQTGMDVYQKCGNAFTGGFLHRGACHGYVAGIASGLVVAGRICLPSGVSEAQLFLVAQSWLRSHPANLNRPAAVTISSAFIASYPCP
jgi:hypothetical protein